MAIPLPANAARQADPALEFLAWADAHQRDKCRHAADLAPITHHHNLNPSGNAVNQLQAWAVRQTQARSRPGPGQARHLHDSVMAQLWQH